MKFAEHLLAHITPEWRRQYIVYEEMKTMLYEAVENIPSAEIASPAEMNRLVRAFDEDFMTFCEKELFKINVFYEEKLAEAKRKLDALRKEIDALALEYQAANESSPLNISRYQNYLRNSISRLVPATNRGTLGISQNTPQVTSAPATSASSSSLDNQHQVEAAVNPSYTKQHSSNTNSLASTNYGTICKKAHFQEPFINSSKYDAVVNGSRQYSISSQINLSGNPKRRQSTISSAINDTKQVGLSSLPDIDRKKLDDIKLAFSEFYLSLVLLQNYQRLNFTGFRKIFKKHDKLIGNEEGKKWFQAHIECAFFHTNKDVDKLIEETENIVTHHLESGDRQKAMKKLRVPPLNDIPNPWTAFRVGLFMGAFIILLFAVVITAIYSPGVVDWHKVSRLYRSSFLVILFIFLVGINIYGWRTHGVNHVLIFELDPRDHLGSQDLIEISFFFGVLWCISLLMFLWSNVIGIESLLNPIALNLILATFLINPTKTFHYTARLWFMRCILRTITAPFHRVRFCDFWFADQMNSLVPVLLDIQYLMCLYLSPCKNSGNSLAWWRFAQCVRRYFDEGYRANPHILNAFKYATVWLVVFFSSLTEQFEDDYKSPLESPFFFCWILSLLFSSTYTYVWDIKMDWGLIDQKAPREYRFLREELVYPLKYYYIAIVEDLLLRFGWTLNLSLTEIGNISPDITTLVLAPCEIFRRFVWNFYRLENEHLNNCGEFRAVRDISISGQNIDMSALNRILRIMDEPDGLTAFRSKVKSKLIASSKKKGLLTTEQIQGRNNEIAAVLDI